MKNLHCPQCDVHRFFVKNEAKDTVLVTVSEKLDIVPVHDGSSLEGFDLTTLYCLGCSWSGSPKSLQKHFH